jgi:hypothetical protein
MRAQIPWLRIIIEGVVIVGSILLAFGIDAWWEGSQERELRIATLEVLLVDFEESHDYLAAIVVANERYLASARLLVASLSGETEDSRVSIPDSLLLTSLTYPTYNPPRASVEMALASGRLTTREDQSLRVLLADWLQDLDDAAEDELRVAELVENKIVPIVAATPGLAEVLADLPGRNMAFRLPEAARHSSRSIEPSAELAGLIGMRAMHTRVALNELSRLATTQQEIVTSLRSALARR